MTEPHDWPFEQPARGTLRPWYLTAAGYLAVLFRDRQEAQRAQRGLLEWGMPENDIRLYLAEEILRIAARQQQERSALAKTIAALVADREARQRYFGNAQAGGSALWLFAPTEDRADQLVGFLADYNYGSLRYYGDQGVKDIHRAVDDSPRHNPKARPYLLLAATSHHHRRHRSDDLEERGHCLGDLLHAIYGPAAPSRPIPLSSCPFGRPLGTVIDRC